MLEANLTSEEQLTLQAYNNHAEPWAKDHATPGFWSSQLATFKRYLPSGKILEVGSGGGRDARILKIEMGYDYVGTDISEALLKQARKAVPCGTFLCQSVYNLNFPSNSFDGFWASAVLLHIPKSRILEALDNIHRVIRPAGIGFVSIKRGYGERIIEEGAAGVKYRRFFSFYDRGEFDLVLNSTGYEIIEEQTVPMSPATTWLVYYVKTVK